MTSSANSLTIIEFLLARIAEDEEAAHPLPGAVDLRAIRECEAKRAIIMQHEAWPVLAEQPPKFEEGVDMRSMTLRVSQNIAWLTEREYVKRFGEEPPTAPMIRTLAAIYSDHPDYRQEWAL